MKSRSSWLIDLTAAAFAKSPDLADFSGRVSDSGEGRWTVLAAVDTGVPASVIAASLYERVSFLAGRTLAARLPGITQRGATSGR